jgi:hypothetical protein
LKKGGLASIDVGLDPWRCALLTRISWPLGGIVCCRLRSEKARRAFRICCRPSLKVSAASSGFWLPALPLIPSLGLARFDPLCPSQPRLHADAGADAIPAGLGVLRVRLAGWVLRSPLFLVKRMLHPRLGAPSDSYRNARGHSVSARFFGLVRKAVLAGWALKLFGLGGPSVTRCMPQLLVGLRWHPFSLALFRIVVQPLCLPVQKAVACCSEGAPRDGGHPAPGGLSIDAGCVHVVTAGDEKALSKMASLNPLRPRSVFNRWLQRCGSTP